MHIGRIFYQLKPLNVRHIFLHNGFMSMTIHIDDIQIDISKDETLLSIHGEEFCIDIYEDAIQDWGYIFKDSERVLEIHMSGESEQLLYRLLSDIQAQAQLLLAGNKQPEIAAKTVQELLDDAVYTVENVSKLSHAYLPEGRR